MRKVTVIAAIFVLSASCCLAEDPFMGDWVGTLRSGGKEEAAAVQVIAVGKDRYEARLLRSFEESGKPLMILTGQKSADGVVLGGPAAVNVSALKLPDDQVQGLVWEGRIAADRLVCVKYKAKDGKRSAGEEPLASLEAKKTVRLSPTLGAKPPAGAIVLLGLDTRNLEAWQNVSRDGKAMAAGWKLVEDGVVEVVPGKGNLVTKQNFGNCRLHLEFRTPFMPDSTGQSRGNSGVYLSGRYEVQVLDSYGLPVRRNECGAIYNMSAPRINMCAPPLQWQTYDIEFTAPKITDGKVSKNARITVALNGVTVQEHVEIKTGLGKGGVAAEQSPTGPLLLQDHNKQVQYRNIWIIPVEE